MPPNPEHAGLLASSGSFGSPKSSQCPGKAAKSMGVRIKHLTDEGEQKEVMSQLPHGSLSNGGLTVPFVKRECLKQVLSIAAP